jgi:adenylosuccinate lyase
LKDILLQEVALRRHLTTADIDRLFDPQNYLGSADIFVDRVLTGARELSTLR